LSLTSYYFNAAISVAIAVTSSIVTSRTRGHLGGSLARFRIWKLQSLVQHLLHQGFSGVVSE
jgi:hypothetical protein